MLKPAQIQFCVCLNKLHHFIWMEALVLHALDLTQGEVTALDDEHTATVLLHVLLALPPMTLQLTYARLAREIAHVEYLKAKISGDEVAKLSKKLEYATARVEELRQETEIEKMHQVEDMIEEYRGDIANAVREVQKEAAPAIIARIIKEIQIN